MHAPRILRFNAAEERCGRVAPALFKVSDLQGMQIRVLGVSNLSLPAEVETAHGHTATRIRVGGDCNSARLMDGLVSGEHVGRGTHGHGSEFKLAGRHVEVE